MPYRVPCPRSKQNGVLVYVRCYPFGQPSLFSSLFVVVVVVAFFPSLFSVFVGEPSHREVDGLAAVEAVAEAAVVGLGECHHELPRELLEAAHRYLMLKQTRTKAEVK